VLLYLCKTCGHKKDEHKDGRCSHRLVFYDQICTCSKYVEIQITDRRTLSKEFDEAYAAHRGFLDSTKDKDGVYIIKDFANALLLHERQVCLWKELTST